MLTASEGGLPRYIITLQNNTKIGEGSCSKMGYVLLQAFLQQTMAHVQRTDIHFSPVFTAALLTQQANHMPRRRHKNRV